MAYTAAEGFSQPLGAAPLLDSCCKPASYSDETANEEKVEAAVNWHKTSEQALYSCYRAGVVILYGRAFLQLQKKKKKKHQLDT
jgi:hypothetical protein